MCGCSRPAARSPMPSSWPPVPAAAWAARTSRMRPSPVARCCAGRSMRCAARPRSAGSSSSRRPTARLPSGRGRGSAMPVPAWSWAGRDGRIRWPPACARQTRTSCSSMTRRARWRRRGSSTGWPRRRPGMGPPSRSCRSSIRLKRVTDGLVTATVDRSRPVPGADPPGRPTGAADGRHRRVRRRTGPVRR